MFRKTILSGLAVAAVAAAAVAYKAIKDRQTEVEEEDDEIHFIEINDEEEEEETKEEEEEPQPITVDLDEEPEDDLLNIPIFHHVDVQQDWQTHEEVAVSEEAKEIAEMYPYLEGGFIQTVLDQNDALNEEFPENTLVSANHTIQFDDAEKMEQFKNIMLEAQYNIVSEEKEKITINKRFFSESGAIISDILNVSNQAVALTGKYLGYELS